MHSPPKNMLSLNYEYLFEVFGNQFIYEHGESKAQELIGTVKATPKVQSYLEALLLRSNYPNSQEVMTLLNSTTYFVFKKSESICLGALIVAMMGLDQYEVYVEKINGEIKTRIVTEIILASLKMKMMKTDSFFDRYFQHLSNQDL